MPINFKITQRLAGFAVSPASGGEMVTVQYRELVAPTDLSHLYDRLEKMQGVLFSSIPGLPPPSQIDHLLVIIQKDLNAVVYVNELSITAMIKPSRSIKKGEAVRASDIEDITSINLGVEVPSDAAVVVLRSYGWRRSLFFDFGPILDNPIPRDYPLESALAKQALLLIGLVTTEVEGVPPDGELPDGATTEAGGEPPDVITTLAYRKAGLSTLRNLLGERSGNEADYQELLQQHPWMLGGVYDKVLRHIKLNDERIPDFTARRCYDLAHDIIEIKQPFLELFRKRGAFAAPFNDAWNQSEKYLTFIQRHRSYLFEEKQLLFENPRCLLLLGYKLDDRQRKSIREKESLAPSITVRTYDEILRTAEHLVYLMETASERIAKDTEPMGS